jgi:hypothetical protein
VPIAGEKVTIPSGIEMLFDVVDTPILEELIIEGKLTFVEKDKNDNAFTAVTLNSKRIWVKGQMVAGSKTERFESVNLNIVLHGVNTDEKMVINPIVDAGSKVLAVTGHLQLFGKEVSKLVARAVETTPANGAHVKVSTADKDLFAVGDSILVVSTSRNIDETEEAIISAIQADGTLELQSALQHIHYGAATVPSNPIASRAQNRQLDHRAEIIKLNRNIVIKGADDAGTTA